MLRARARDHSHTHIHEHIGGLRRSFRWFVDRICANAEIYAHGQWYIRIHVRCARAWLKRFHYILFGCALNLTVVVFSVAEFLVAQCVLLSLSTFGCWVNINHAPTSCRLDYYSCADLFSAIVSEESLHQIFNNNYAPWKMPWNYLNLSINHNSRIYFINKQFNMWYFANCAHAPNVYAYIQHIAQAWQAAPKCGRRNGKIVYSFLLCFSSWRFEHTSLQPARLGCVYMAIALAWSAWLRSVPHYIGPSECVCVCACVYCSANEASDMQWCIFIVHKQAWMMGGSHRYKNTNLFSWERHSLHCWRASTLTGVCMWVCLCVHVLDVYECWDLLCRGGRKTITFWF